ncbi:MAG: photosystem reaction center subunit H [Thermoplasmata archaeon]|nr:PRC-barrel domain-containing protein [Thermoplasmata archaeon]RLF26420.1 MAG: photosystem reaction center subunit H [Thermoplasmata archaeon]HDJ27410.1 photosystem reaction center subunit H [Aciduliprofundum sp.]
MLKEGTELIGMDVYTDKAIHLGKVDDLLLDVRRMKVYGLYIGHTNPNLVEDGVAVSVPYRWVKAVGEIIILKKFPPYVSVPPAAKE